MAQKTAKRASAVPFGVVCNLPVWQCNGCDGWQSGISADGIRIRPRHCRECGPGQTYHPEMGWCKDHRRVVLALLGKGWKFPAGTKEWAMTVAPLVG